MRISVDIDGILNRFVEEVVKISDKLWPGKLPEGFTSEGWITWEGPPGVFSKQDWNTLWDVINDTEDFWEKSSSYLENVSDLRKFLISGNNKDVFFVTSRAKTKGKSVQAQTYNWMTKNLLPVASYVNYSAIVPVSNSKLKRQVMEGLDIKFSTDDYGPTVEMCNQIPGHQAFVLDRPWNRDKDYGPRVYTLAEFLEKTQ